MRTELSWRKCSEVSRVICRALCFDTIITQLYEYDISIDRSVYEQIEAIGRSMGLPADSWTMLQELLVPPESLPEPIQIKLNDIFK